MLVGGGNPNLGVAEHRRCAAVKQWDSQNITWEKNSIDKLMTLCKKKASATPQQMPSSPKFDQGSRAVNESPHRTTWPKLRGEQIRPTWDGTGFRLECTTRWTHGHDSVACHGVRDKWLGRFQNKLHLVNSIRSTDSDVHMHERQEHHP